MAIAFGQVRGYRLVLASLQDGDDASRMVLEEIGDCAECLRSLVFFLAAMAGGFGERMAEMAGQDHDAAVRQFEKLLGEAIDKLLQY